MQKVENKNTSTPADVEQMFQAGAHYGYGKSRRHPSVSPYIYATKNKTDIIDLEKTGVMLGEAVQFVKSLGAQNKTILFVGTKPGVNKIIKKAANEIGMPNVANRWIGGTLTNFKVIRNRILDFEKLKKDIEVGELEKYTKKEKIKINKEFERMERIFSGLENLAVLPGALIIVDSKEEATALREARRLNIPVIAVLNSDCDPAAISYLIPANDAAPKSVEYNINRLVEGYKGLEK